MEATAIQSVEKNITMVALANVQPSNYNHARILTKRVLWSFPKVFVSRVCYNQLEYA